MRYKMADVLEEFSGEDADVEDDRIDGEGNIGSS